ncbi:alpha/beta fold hydrolase [Cupriavidus taiwanensis]|uniref:alpha/beta fold hydrolase n=1 Tax=Cupriavidus taiwanensis TaxID=164546 RepID=UPI001571890C|nr:alpha/beta fold hydrolase [Cupriavidus taiwanensis]NSX16269.1 alpha/beta fold hydrolase [Cupriavidus taiwanensis]
MTTRAADLHAADDAGLLARLERMGVRHDVAHLGRNVVWRRFGEGPPLVLLHGGHGNWMHWVRNIEALAARHTLWLADMPGFGDSDALAGDDHAPDRLERLVQALIATLDQLVGEDNEIAIAGFSFGALVAAHIAARRPRVTRLALLGPAGHGGARRQGQPMQDWRIDDEHEMRRRLRHNLLALMLHDEKLADGLAMAVHEQACKATRFRSRTISRQASLGNLLAAYRRPTLLMWGEHDVTAVPVEAAQQLASSASHRDWCVIPAAGHWVQFERWQEVNPMLLRWFSDASASPA